MSDTDTLDIYYTNNYELSKRNESFFDNHIILTNTHDDAFNRQPSEQLSSMQSSLNMPDTGYYKCKHTREDENRFGYLKKNYCLINLIVVITFFLAGVAVFVYYYILKASPAVSSMNYPLLNYNSCDPRDSYYLRSWFTPPSIYSLSCDIPIPISEIFIEALKTQTMHETRCCLDKLDCISAIGMYYMMSHDSKFNFFIDCDSNVYAGRGWLCPYESGQLWVAVMGDTTYQANGDSEMIKNILKHFNTEIVNYGEKCAFFSKHLRTTKILNVSVIVSTK